MIEQVSSEMMPDISRPRILVAFDVKYDMKPIVNIRKVSVTAEMVSDRMCFNISDVIKPKITPMATETTASAKNCPKIRSGVVPVKLVPCSSKTVLKSTIDTMSLKTPSPKMHEYSFG
jgi:hypothetical protein